MIGKPIALDSEKHYIFYMKTKVKEEEHGIVWYKEQVPLTSLSLSSPTCKMGILKFLTCEGYIILLGLLHNEGKDVSIFINITSLVPIIVSGAP